MWRESDSVIRQFRDGDYILVTIHAPPGDTPESTRDRFCLSERHLLQQHYILTDSSIESTDDSPSHHSPSESERSRSRSRRNADRSPTPPWANEHDSPSLLQIGATRRHLGKPYQRPQQEDGLRHPCFPSGTTVGEVESQFKRSLRTIEEGIQLVYELECDHVGAHSGNQVKVNLDLTIDTFDRYAHFSSVDMCRAYRCLSMLRLPPFLHWNDISTWHPATVTAFDELTPLPWEHFTPVRFAFYTDGGSKSGEEYSRQGAAAVILIVTTHVGHHFGGIQARTVSHPATAPLTEAWALLQATLWATSILNAFPHAYLASFAFNGDAIGPGAVATGRWFPNVHTHVHNLSRNIVFWVEERIGAPCEWEHIKAHSGHPWNEAADTVATCVLDGALSTPDCEHLNALVADLHQFTWLPTFVVEAHQQ